MRYVFRLLCVCALSVIPLVGCAESGGAGDAYDYEGFWLVQSLGMAEQTLVRGGTPQGLLADAVVTATSSTEAAVQARWAITQDGILEGDWFDQTVTIEPGKWVISMDDGTGVFSISLNGDTLTLTADPDDPRHDDDSGVTEVVMQRVDPWGTQSVGSWEISGLDRCVSDGSGGYQIITVTMEIDDRWIISETITWQSYIDPTCMTAMGQPRVWQVDGYVEEQGDELRMWFVEGFLRYTFAANGADLDLTRTACDEAEVGWCSRVPVGFTLTPAP